MAPDPGGPTSPAPITAVDPGAIDAFATYLDRQADGWERTVDRFNLAAQEQTTDDGFRPPEFGELPGAETLRSNYTSTTQGSFEAAKNIYERLRAYAEAARQIAADYRDVEALNGATAEDIQRLIDAQLAETSGAPGSEPPDSIPPPGVTPPPGPTGPNPSPYAGTTGPQSV